MSEGIPDAPRFAINQTEKISRLYVIFIKKKALFQICRCTGEIGFSGSGKRFVIKTDGCIACLSEHIHIYAAIGTATALRKIKTTIRAFHVILSLCLFLSGGLLFLLRNML